MFARRLFLLASLSLACLATAVVHVRADSVADAKALIASGDVDGGSAMLNAVAASGDAATQYAAGTALLDLGNDDDALRWITSSAESGHAKAQADLGLLYASGTLVKQNLPRALCGTSSSSGATWTPRIENVRKIMPRTCMLR